MDRSRSVISYQQRRLVGSDIQSVLSELAELRIQTFSEYPYLYEGSLEYEKKYLNRYVKSQKSFFFGLWDKGVLIGATTGLPLCDEDMEFQKPFLDQKKKLNTIFYFGESLLLPKYRGQKIGHLFFDEREKFSVRENQFSVTCFCSVIRPENHPLKPHDYRSHDSFWTGRGYQKSQMLAQFEWRDRNETFESKKNLEFWIKDWKQ